MYYLPEEIEVWYIIPAIRRTIAKSLIEEYKFTYEKVGGILGVSKAAISQYLKGKRAAKIKLPDEIQSHIKKSCDLLSKQKSTAPEEITKIIKFIRDKKLPCQVCGKLKEGTLTDCDTIKFDGINYH